MAWRSGMCAADPVVRLSEKSPRRHRRGTIGHQHNHKGKLPSSSSSTISDGDDNFMSMCTFCMRVLLFCDIRNFLSVKQRFALVIPVP